MEFLFSSPPDCVYLLPTGLENDTRMLSRKNMVFRQIEDVFVESFVVLGSNTENNDSLQKLYEYVREKDYRNNFG